MSKPISHHYLPRGILKSFCYGKKEKLFFYSKDNGMGEHPSGLRGLACINKFYDYKGQNKSLEVDLFNKIDSDAAIIVRKILLSERLPILDAVEMEGIAIYVASQICRVPYVLDALKRLAEGFVDDVSSDFKIFDGDVKSFFLEHVKPSSELYKEILLKKRMTVFRSDDDRFIIGDNPVVFFDHGNVVVRDKYSSAISAKVFMLPISPSSVLVFYDEDAYGNLQVYLSQCNRWQFINAVDKVFSGSEALLLAGEKQYYKDAYEYVVGIDPGYVKHYGIVKGDRIRVALPRIAFKGEARNVLRDMIR
ncbi:DUF4238 domain-containing protein [Pseudomonas sediminis]|uniref:DUF4238 domain-containing protein n=1 Tax=Pseudomonas sediminis TaxID=1691904 RepID=A0A2G5FUC2_9PSED|nr:DUF4238 domain-containing protein [Pseudomonas sediminis]PIA71560.1 hypothetical protein CDO35_00790 [Pseudomonas sediminis]